VAGERELGGSQAEDALGHGEDGIEMAPVGAGAVGDIAQSVDLALPNGLVAEQARQKDKRLHGFQRNVKAGLSFAVEKAIIAEAVKPFRSYTS
jgi:hypothetical protein